ncbi:hypothetical protein ADUPG1_000664, partial [Aduncisulcus paluster]
MAEHGPFKSISIEQNISEMLEKPIELTDIISLKRMAETCRAKESEASLLLKILQQRESDLENIRKVYQELVRENIILRKENKSISMVLSFALQEQTVTESQIKSKDTERYKELYLKERERRIMCERLFCVEKEQHIAVQKKIMSLQMAFKKICGRVARHGRESKHSKIRRSVMPEDRVFPAIPPRVALSSNTNGRDSPPISPWKDGSMKIPINDITPDIHDKSRSKISKSARDTLEASSLHSSIGHQGLKRSSSHPHNVGIGNQSSSFVSITDSPSTSSGTSASSSSYSHEQWRKKDAMT